MNTRFLFLLGLAVMTTACETRVVGPSIISPLSVAAVATSRPNLWDSREELAAWVNNGASTGSTTIVGDGNDAVIRIDVSQGDARLHGPDFDPPITLQATRLRYRWIGRGSNDVLFVTMYLRPAVFDQSLDIPHLFYIPGDLSRPPEEASGAWVDQLLTAHGTSTPPYSVRFPQLEISGSGIYAPGQIHGTVEIDWIALVQ